MNTSRDAFMADLDSDGDLDIYTFVFGSQNLIWENDGAGNFTAATPIAGDLFNTFSGFFVQIYQGTDLSTYILQIMGKINYGY
jgi:hypothetical protein